ncbi:MAG TPA: hypothetical protein VGL91_16400 [Acidobacteriota bacterium]|jgi:hypothetical protein
MKISRRFFQIADEVLSSIDNKAQNIFSGFLPWPQKSKELYGTYYYQEARKTEVGFFLGYLLIEKDRPYLSPLPPECFFFVFVHPISRPLHRRLVRRDDGLFPLLYQQLAEKRNGVADFHLLRDKLPALYCKHSLRGIPTSEMALTSLRFFHDALKQINALGVPRRLASAL